MMVKENQAAPAECRWYPVNPLPKQCCDMTSTLHQDEVVFTDRDGELFQERDKYSSSSWKVEVNESC